MAISEHVLASGMRLWSARPDTDEPRPLMVMLHERYGPVRHSFDVIQRTAGCGFTACVPDLFHRYEGERGPIERSEARYDPTDEQTIADLDEAIAFMRTLPFVEDGKVGVVGFCQSGRTPMVYAASGRDITAAALFHGGIYPRDYEPTLEGQESTASFLPRVGVPILGGFGEHDPLVPLENVRRFRGDLESLGKRARLRVFAGAPHGWMDAGRKEHRPAAAEASWELIAGFFAEAFAGQLGPAPNVEFQADPGIDFDFSS